jgi:uncharacterized protein YutE (UPF0331/DUF86 family)
MVDAPKVEQLLARLSQYREVLGGLSTTPREEFLASGDKIGNAKYHFVVAIECCIDIANHVIASEGFRIPTTNADSLTVLVEQKVLPQAYLRDYQAMARCRNRLVHLYWDVDNESVYSYLQDGLKDLDSFATAIAMWMDHTSS